MIKDRFLKDVKGNVAIEFAIVSPFLFLLLAGIIDFGFILVNKNRLNSAVSAGILYAGGKSKTPAEVRTVVEKATTLTLTKKEVNEFCQCLGGAQPCSSITCTGGETPGRYIEIIAESKVDVILPIVVESPFKIRAEGIIRTE